MRKPALLLFLGLLPLLPLQDAIAQPVPARIAFCKDIRDQKPVDVIMKGDGTPFYFWIAWDNFPTGVPVQVRYTVSGPDGKISYEKTYPCTARSPRVVTALRCVPDFEGECTFNVYLDGALRITKSIPVKPTRSIASHCIRISGWTILAAVLFLMIQALRRAFAPS